MMLSLALEAQLHAGQKRGKQLYMYPEECFDCGSCLPECPVVDIYENEVDAIEEDELEYVQKN